MSDRTGTRFDAPLEIAQSGSPIAGPSRARRRLLLGAAAALPSVYTLTSGAQTAAASALNCLATTTPPNLYLSRFTTHSDAWTRKQVYMGKVANDNAYCVTWNQSSCVNALTPDKSADGSVWIHNNNGVRMVSGPRQTVAKIGLKPQAYGLVYVDAKGTITTLDPNGNPSLQPASASCMASMIGSAKSLLG
jgi:hypothetical protein